MDSSSSGLSISKSYQRLKGKDVITTPKTKKSNRVIKMPKFLCGEMEDYLKMFYSTGQMNGFSLSASTISTMKWTEVRKRRE